MNLQRKILIGTGAVVVLAALSMLQPSNARLACDEVAEIVVDRFTDRFMHPVRVFDLSEVDLHTAQTVCEGRAWWNSGDETGIRIRVEYADGNQYVFYEATNVE